MTALSFEFYPPKTDEQRAQLDRAAAKLKAYAPEYVSCTFGAGGSTLSYTSETVRHLNQHPQPLALSLSAATLREPASLARLLALLKKNKTEKERA